MKTLLWKVLMNFYIPAVFTRRDIKNILVIRMNKIGDMICTIPLLKTIKKEFPDTSLTLLTEDTNVDIISNASYIDRLLIYTKGTGINRNRILHIRQLLRGNAFDIAIGVKAGFSSNLAMATYFSGARYRVGYRSSNHHPYELLYNIHIGKEDSVQHQVEQCLNLLRPLGISPDRFVRDVSIEIPEEAVIKLKKFMARNSFERTIVVNISNNSSDTTWAAENFKVLIDELRKNHIKSIITSVPDDADKAKKLADDCSTQFYETPHIMDFAAAVKCSELLICHDSGAMHIGASAGTRTLVLVGRGITPEVWGPYGKGHKCILKSKINDIKVKEVIEESLAMLDIKK